MARFIACVYRSEDLPRWRERHPDHHFTFVAPWKLDAAGPDQVAGAEPFVRSELARLHANEPFAGVLNAGEGLVPLAARIANDLALPTALSDPMLARDKLRMHEALAKHVARPACALLSSRGAPVDIDPPWIVKPRFGFDSIGVAKVAEPGQLARRVARLRRALSRLSFEALMNDDLLIEEWVGGSEHSVETLVWKGEVLAQLVSDKWPMPAAYPVETGEVMPSRLGESDRGRVERAAVGAAAALGIRNGWSHCEVKLHGGEAYVIECAARMGGGYFDPLIREVYGIDRMRDLIELHLDRWQPGAQPSARVAIARRLQPARSTWVMGVREPEAPPGARRYRVTSRERIGPLGRLVRLPPLDYRHTLMEWMVCGDSFDAALRRHEEVEAALAVRGLPIPQWLAARLPG